MKGKGATLPTEARQRLMDLLGLRREAEVRDRAHQKSGEQSGNKCHRAVERNENTGNLGKTEWREAAFILA